LRRRYTVSPDAWAVIVIVAAVLVANLPYLGGWFNPDPLVTRSGLAAGVHPGLLAGKATIDPNVGYSSQAIGHLAARDLLRLRLPWWNPYEGTGMPLAGETQAAALFAPTVLTAWSNGQLYEHILLELVAGLCTYLLLRRLALARWIAAAGGIAFALNGTFAWFAHAAVNPVPFLPMMLLGVERAFAAVRTGRPAGWRLLGLAGALSLYAGFPEIAYIDALLVAGWAAWRCGCLERGQVRPFLIKVALGAAAAVLVAAPMLVAMNGDLTQADVGLHANGQLGGDHLSASAVPQLLMPYVYGPINGTVRVSTWLMVGGYLSTLLLALALLGVAARGRLGLRAVLFGWAILAFARMAGQPPLLGDVLGVLPDMSKIEFFRYAWPSLELAVIVLAALGIDDLARVPEHRWRPVWASLVIAGVGVVAALGAQPLAHRIRTQYHLFSLLSVVWAGVVLAGVVVVVLIRSPRVRGITIAAVLAVEAVGLFVVPEFSAPRGVSADLTPVAYLRRHLGDSRFFTLGPIQPNYGTYFGLATLNVNDFTLDAYAHYVRARLDPVVDPNLFVGTKAGWRPPRAPSPETELIRHLAGYRAAAVRYVLTPPGQRLPRRSFRLVFRSRTTWIYALQGAAGYFTAPGCTVDDDGRTDVALTCPRATTLVRRETWFAGWSARIDGRPARIRHAGGLFQAVVVPPGTHRVTFSYAPPDIRWAWVAFLAGCALMLGPTIAIRVDGRERARPLRAGPALPAGA
jgi:membrane protein YfhO